MRRNLIDLRSFVIIVSALGVMYVVEAREGLDAAITAGVAVLLTLHTIIK